MSTDESTTQIRQTQGRRASERQTDARAERQRAYFTDETLALACYGGRRASAEKTAENGPPFAFARAARGPGFAFGQARGTIVLRQLEAERDV